MKRVVAVFDIGKTNKKFLLFDEKYNVVQQNSISIEEIEDEDGFPCEDLDTLLNWVDERWKEAITNSEFKIKALNFATYGASLVYVGYAGERLAPLYNYLKPMPSELASEFLDNYGDVSLATASPQLGMLNSGMQIYWIKQRRPDLFKSTKYALHFPNFLAYHFSGKPVSDLTSIGCHTALWDFEKEFYHPWVRHEKVGFKLAPLAKSALLETRDEDDLAIGCGLHDSSAAVIPYLSSFTDTFTLVSTGTWCVNLNPFSESLLTTDELDKDGLCYMQFDRNLIKASRIFLGKEHDAQVSKISLHFDCDHKFLRSLELSEKILKTAMAKNNSLKPSEMKGTGPYPDLAGDWDVTSFDTAEEAYHHLILDLVCIEKTSLDLITRGSKDLFVEGGFADNDLFVGILSAFYLDRDTYRSSIAQASALGAAMQMHYYWNSADLKKEGLVKIEKVEPKVDGQMLMNYYKECWE
jgi:L-fuculokinase